MTPTSDIELELADLNVQRATVYSRRALAGLMAMLLLVCVSTVLLAVFLGKVEQQDIERQQATDADWLDQTLRFHFKRLEDDLAALPANEQGANQLPARPGALLRSPDAWAARVWVSARAQPFTAAWPSTLPDELAQPAMVDVLAALLDTARGLQKPSYAGPLPAAGQADRDVLWLAVPHFQGDRFLGNHVMALRLDRLLLATVPPWFLADHVLGTPADAEDTSGTSPLQGVFDAPIHLPGAQWTVQVKPTQPAVSTAPRAFFGIALVCLLGMAATLALLWRDTQRRRRIESALHTQLALRSAMERSVTLGLRAWDINGRLIYVNEAFGRMVGWPADTLRQTTTPPYWDASLGPELDWLRTTLLAEAQAQTGTEATLRHQDGHSVAVLLHLAPLLQRNGVLLGWMGSAVDITERKRVEQLAARQQAQLDASARLVAVGEVASTLAHELNQPLGALSSFANGLLNRVQQGRITEGELVSVVERMERLADKAGRVIQRVNAFARRQEMSRHEMDLCAFVSQVMRHIGSPTGVSLRWEAPETPVLVQADAQLLEHAVKNVVNNALEWSASGGLPNARVRVQVVCQADMAGIEVHDSGPGVPPSQRTQIFNAFTSHRPGGMGMGLSICRSIMEAHGGRIEVGSSPDLGGAQFTLWLPLTH